MTEASTVLATIAFVLAVISLALRAIRPIVDRRWPPKWRLTEEEMDRWSRMIEHEKILHHRRLTGDVISSADWELADFERWHHASENR